MYTSMRHGLLGSLLRRGGGAEVEREVAYGVLSNPRRRAVARHLLDLGHGVDIGELAEAVAAWEHGVERSRLTGAQRKRLYVPLHQTHLPKMQEAGLLRYERPRGDVVPEPGLEAVRCLVGPSLHDEAGPLRA